MDRSGGSKRADTKGPLINAMKTDSASITPSDVYVLSTARLRVRLSVHTRSVRLSRGTSASVCSECMCGCQCVFAKPYMHERASQSVCASATVSTPLGLSTKPAQRQMGNFLRGKGGRKKIWSGSKSSRMCVFPSSFKE